MSETMNVWIRVNEMDVCTECGDSTSDHEFLGLQQHVNAEHVMGVWVCPRPSCVECEARDGLCDELGCVDNTELVAWASGAGAC